MPLAPKILYGTAWHKKETFDRVIAAVLNGFRAIDTAGQTLFFREDLVGQALRELKENRGIKREDLFIQTRYARVDFHKDHFRYYDPFKPVKDQVYSSCTKSLETLGTDYIDSYLLYAPMPTMPKTLQAWRALMGLQDEGKVRTIGISNTYDVDIIQELSKKRKVEVVQNRWCKKNNWDKDVLDYCRESGITYQAYWSTSDSKELLSHPSLRNLARESNISPTQAVYMLAQSEGIVPLSGSTKDVDMLDDVALENRTFPYGSEELVEELRAYIRS